MSSQGNVQDCDELDMLAAAMEYEFSILPEEKRREELQQLEVLMDTELFVYSYFDIPPEAAVIRLLRLNPGSALEPLTATLQFSALSGSTRYEALSYAWGNPAKTHSISIDGQVLPITRSLYEALHRLRLTNKERVLWVDAICINQQAMDEKSRQVNLMGRIYSTATCVLCWLGVDTPRKDGATALTLLTNLSSAGPCTRHTNIREWVATEGLPKHGDERWKSLGVFFKSPWFQRRWVIQEFIKGKEVTLICGDLEIDWVDIIYGLERCTEFMLLDWAFDDNMIGGTGHRVASMGMMNFSAIVRLKPRADGYSSYAMLIRRTYEGRYASPRAELELFRLVDPALMRVIYQGMTTVEKLIRTGGLELIYPDALTQSLGDLLRTCGSSFASDPRDYIFALLGLAEDGEGLTLQVDYRQSVRTLYTRCSRYLIEKGAAAGSIEWLICADTSRVHDLDSSTTFPSWVCNWADAGMFKPKPTMLREGARSAFYRAASETTLQLRFDADDLDLLYMTGGFFSSIKRIIRNPTCGIFRGGPLQLLQLSRAIRDYLLQIDEVMLNRGKRYPYLARPSSYIYDPDSIEHDFEALWRLLICNTIDGATVPGEETEFSFLEFRYIYELPETNTQRPPLTIAQRMQAFLRNVPELKDAAERPLSWEVQWVASAHYLTFAELHNGLCGLVPYTSDVGDRVFIPLGSGVPLILRNSVIARVPARFELVGGAYVHGIMDGEALNTPDWRVEEVCIG